MLLFCFSFFYEELSELLTLCFMAFETLPFNTKMLYPCWKLGCLGDKFGVLFRFLTIIYVNNTLSLSAATRTGLMWIIKMLMLALPNCILWFSTERKY